MNRAPIAAWQGLFAAGGSPAASHAALARVPVREKLLAPLAGSTLVREKPFDALVRPLELGGVIGKRVRSTAGANEAADQGQTDGDAQKSRAASGFAVERRARGAPALAPDEDGRGGRTAADRRHPMPPRESRPARAIAAPRFASTGAPHAVASAALDAGDARLLQRAADRSTTSALRQGAHVSRQTSVATTLAARTPVIIDPASRDVDRLLAAADAPIVARGARGSVVRDETSANAPGRTSSALDRVLDRIAVQRPAPASANDSMRSDRSAVAGALATSLTRSGTARAPTAVEVAPPTTRLQPAVSAPSASVEHASGGFRGLATRALQQSESALPAVSTPSPRLTQEMRTISDLPLDALDASVADSVTRVLQREARRHGIDLAGVGT